MGTTDISVAKVSGEVIDETWYNDFRKVNSGDLVPRDALTSEVVSKGGDLGSTIFPWDVVHACSLIIEGSLIDFGNLGGDPNAIISGQVRSTSAFPDFIRANGAAPSFTLEAATTNLVLNIDSLATIYVDDIVEAGLATAPTSQNTCQVNDSNLTGQESSKTQGENGTQIIIDNAGNNITNRIGQYVIFKTSTEFMLAFISSATLLTNVYRGYFLDSSGLPLNRVPLNNNDTLSIMSAGWVFVENDGLTIDVTFNSPIVSNVEPSSPSVGDYWFDREEGNAIGTWKRFDGASFVQINRNIIGIVAIDATNCIASRSFNFSKNFADFNPVDIKFFNNSTVITARSDDFTVNVYGKNVFFRHTGVSWDIATDLEAGQSEASNTTYYFYITEKGETIISDIAPYDERGILKGFYHPYNTWRNIGSIFNNGSSNFDAISRTRTSLGTAAFFDAGTEPCNVLKIDADGKLPAIDGSNLTGVVAGFKSIRVFTSSGTYNKPTDITLIYVAVVGGGGGGAGSGVAGSDDGGNGGTSSFGGFLSATGGAGADAVTNNSVPEGGKGGVGGTGSGGNINIKGQPGGYGHFRIVGGDMPAGYGGSSTRGGGGRGGGGDTAPSNQDGENGGNFGGGGGSAANLSVATPGGGGGGGTAEELLSSPPSSTSVTVGSAGSGGGGGEGGTGAKGIVIVYEYQ